MKKFENRAALYIIPWICLLGGWLIGALSGEKSEIAGAWLLLSSALLFGLPHGAYDFWILFDSTRRARQSFSALAGFLAIYTALALLVVGIWYFSPGASLIIFLALSAWHFGSGDVVWEAESKNDLVLDSVGRGLLLISAPLAFYPNQSGSVLTMLDAQAAEFLLYIAPYTLAAGVLLILLNACAAFFRQSKPQIESRLPIWLETIFLLLFFRLTTPLLAVTVYLIGVHSWRHLLRLELYEQNEKAFENKKLRHIIRRFHERALPITLVSLSGLILIFWLWQFRISDLASHSSAYLVLLSALTVPHAALITWTELNRLKLRLFDAV